MRAAANGEGQAAKTVASAIRNSPFATPADKAKKTAQEFETMFLEQTLERVFASSGTEGPLGDNGTGGQSENLSLR